MWCTLHATHGVVLTIFRVIHVHFETDLHLLGLLNLLHLLDHRNLSPHAPGDLGNLIDDLHMRNLHDFWQSGCSTHLRLHFRIIRACVWFLNLFPLHNWACIKAWISSTWSKKLIMWCFLWFSGRFESVWTCRYVTIRWLTNVSLCSTCGTRTVGTCLYCT